jgi:hypothetical membrane protein
VDLSVRVLRYFGLMAAVSAWVVILTCIFINPWFNLFRNAFSDLGGPKATDPWIYNYGLVGVAVLVLAYSVQLAVLANNKLETMGSAFAMVASFFLALIGVYHEGTYPHVFVSTWFFVQFGVTIAFWGFGLLKRGRTRLGAANLVLLFVAAAVSIAVKWPSTATLEAWGIASVDAWTILMFWVR